MVFWKILNREIPFFKHRYDYSLSKRYTIKINKGWMEKYYMLYGTQVSINEANVVNEKWCWNKWQYNKYKNAYKRSGLFKSKKDRPRVRKCN